MIENYHGDEPKHRGGAERCRRRGGRLLGITEGGLPETTSPLSSRAVKGVLIQPRLSRETDPRVLKAPATCQPHHLR